MTPGDIQQGRTYLISTGCGVPYEWAPLTLRVISVDDPGYPGDDFAWITGYQIDNGRAVTKRTVYVGQVSGMKHLTDPPRAHAAQRLLKAAARNTGPAVIPRPRTSPETVHQESGVSHG